MKEKIITILSIIFFILVIIGIKNYMASTKNQEENIIETNEEMKKVEIEEVNEDNFDDKVINNSGIVLIDFYATWCNPCKMLEPTIEEFAEENKEIKVVKVDVDKCEKLVFDYRIHAMPTLIVIKNGKETNRVVGVVSKVKILELIEE